MMRKGHAVATVVAALVCCACGSSSAPAKTDDGGEASPQPTRTDTTPTAEDPLAGVTLDPKRKALAQTASTFVAKIGELENKKDVTCWTSFRQLDNFIAEKSYSDAATLTKIVASKALVHGAWAAASKAAAGEQVTAADLEKIVGNAVVELPEEKKVQLQKFGETQKLQEFRDYRTTSEHWRVVLSVAQDELARPVPEVKPLSADGVDALALFATRVGLSLLTESGEIATEARAPFIDPPHVQKAYENLRTEMKVPSHTPSAFESDPKVAKAVRAPMTERLIDVKVKALQEYNDARDVYAALGRISKVPFEKEAVDTLLVQLTEFARLFTAGYEPMRGDNYLADGNFAPGTGPGRDYIDAAYVENAIMQRWPHVMMPNGDLKMRFELRPGHISPRELEAQDVTLLDHHMNAIRDTAIQWIVLERLYDEAPYAMDPFAAEYLSEIVSVVATFYVRRAQTQARADNAAAITPEHIRRAEDVGFAMVMPKLEAQSDWGPKDQARKDAALAAYKAPRFSDVTGDWGLPTSLPAVTVADPGDASFDIQEVMGSGTAIGDIDGDGYTDLFMAGPGLHKLWRNEGKAGPGFEDITAAWGIGEPADDGRGALMVDYDGDGDLDLYVVRSHNPSQLFENTGGKLKEVAKKRGLVTGRGAHVGTWLDYDGDGDLDLYVGYYGSAACNAGKCEGRNLPSLDGRNGTPNQLFRNDGGSFTEVAAAAKADDHGWTLAASTFDYDRDGDLDIYLANDFGANPLLRNNGDGTFTDVAAQLGAADRGSGMNVSFTDLEGDGDFDVYVSNIDMFSKTIKFVFPSDESVVSLDDRVLRAFQYLSGNKLYENQVGQARDGAGGGFASVEGAHFEPGDRGWGWGAPFFDYENDGDEDMYLTNGWIEGSPASDQKNQLYLRDGDTFYLADPASPEAFAGNSRSVVAFDADGDGDVDLAVNNYAGAPRLLRNDQTAGKRWLKVRLKGTGLNTRAIGAVVEARAGGETMRRQVTCGLSYLGQDDEVVNFGLGSATKADVTVVWPDGSTQRFAGLAAGKTHELAQKAVAK